VIASMQPLHAPFSADGGDVWLERVGRERWAYSFAWQALREAGAVLAFGSDWPVVSPNPMLGIHNAVNRLSWGEGLPNHRQTLADTLAAYTRNAAYAEFQEDTKGQIKAGYSADLVLLSEDIFATPAAELRRVHPVFTMVNGRVVYTA
jgi:predicted amidohydrolase YtcJ